MVVGALKLILHLDGAGSLKAKRKVVRSITDRTRAKFNVSVSEVGANDLWQRIELGFAVCANQHGFVEKQLAEVGRFVERLALAEIVDERIEVMSLKDMTWAPLAGDQWTRP